MPHLSRVGENTRATQVEHLGQDFLLWGRTHPCRPGGGPSITTDQLILFAGVEHILQPGGIYAFQRIAACLTRKNTCADLRRTPPEFGKSP
jgi:hypothetical protein